MTALTKDIDTPQVRGELIAHPVAATAVCYAGGIAVLDATGYAEPATATTGLITVGRVEEYADNGSGADGDINVTVRRGVFRFANSGTNTIDRTDIGGTAYAEDDQTVGSLATGMSAVGKILNVDADGVWVEIQ